MSDLTHLRVDQWSIAFLNERISACKTPFLIISDNRISLSEDEVSELLNILKRDDTIAIVQPKVLVSESDRIHPFGGLGGFIDRLGVGFIRGAAFGESEQDLGQYDKLNNDPDWIYSPVMLMRCEAIRKVCGLDLFDLEQTAWMDLGARLRRMGYRLDCYSSVVSSLPVEIKSSGKPAVTSRLYPTTKYVTRHINGPWVLVVLIWILLELIYVPGNLLQFRFRLAATRLMSLGKTLIALPEMIRDRYLVREGIDSIRVSKEKVHKPVVGSVFWDHYVRLGKTASNLLTIFLVIASVFSLTMRDRR